MKGSPLKTPGHVGETLLPIQCDLFEDTVPFEKFSGMSKLIK